MIDPKGAKLSETSRPEDRPINFPVAGVTSNARASAAEASPLASASTQTDDEETLRQQLNVDILVNMGFSRHRADQALRCGDSTVDSALNWLSEHDNEEERHKDGDSEANAKIEAPPSQVSKLSRSARNIVAPLHFPRKSKAVEVPIGEPPFPSEPPLPSPASKPAETGLSLEVFPPTEMRLSTAVAAQDTRHNQGHFVSAVAPSTGIGNSAEEPARPSFSERHQTDRVLDDQSHTLHSPRGSGASEVVGAADEGGTVVPVASAVLFMPEEGGRQSGLEESVIVAAPIRMRWMKISVAVMFVCVVGIGLAFGLLLGKGDGTSQQTQGDSKASVGFITALREKICTDLPTTCADLSTEGTPQSKAFELVKSDSKFEEYEEWKRVQRYVLATIGYSLSRWGKSDTVDRIDTSTNECSWVWGPPESQRNKIVCNRSGRVTEIGFHRNLVGKKVPRDVALLAESLENLFFCCVDFQGSIPTELGMLTKLKYLGLGRNKLSGPLPTELGRLAQLEELWLHNNDLTGTMPEEVCDLRRPKGLLERLGADCKEEMQCDCCNYCAR